jgi:hypothetical protein
LQERGELPSLCSIAAEYQVRWPAAGLRQIGQHYCCALSAAFAENRWEERKKNGTTGIFCVLPGLLGAIGLIA